MVEERNFAELAGEFACDNFWKRHETGLGFVDQPRNPVVFW
jgi:hypothetical protein